MGTGSSSWEKLLVFVLLGSNRGCSALQGPSLICLSCPSSSDLAAFIREVQRRNGNSVAGLGPDEIISRTTELILDQQLKVLGLQLLLFSLWKMQQHSPKEHNSLLIPVQAPPRAGRAGHPPGSAAPAPVRSRESSAEGSGPASPPAAPAPKNSSSKKPSQPNLQPWGNAGAASKTKWKKQDNVSFCCFCGVVQDVKQSQKRKNNCLVYFVYKTLQ